MFPPEKKKRQSYVTFPKEEKINKQSPKGETSHFCLPLLQARKKKHPWQTVGRDVAASLLKETRYNLLLSCYLKKTITWKPLSLMIITHTKKEIHTWEQSSERCTNTPSQADTVLKVSILDLKRHQEAKGLSGKKMLFSLSIDWQLRP